MNATIHAPGCADLDPALCVRQSQMKVLASSSLAHVWAQYLDPARKPESTRQQELGTLLHALTLEPARFAEAFRIAPDANLTTLVGSQLLLTWLVEQAQDLLLPVPKLQGSKLYELHASIVELRALLAPHCTIATAGDIADARRMHANLWSFPQIARILAHPGIQTETRLIWRDSSGAPCQATLDLFIAPCQEYPSGLIVDLKSARSAQRNAFLKQAEQLAYHWQADHYRRGFSAVYGTLPPYVWIIVENTNPFCANLIPCGDDLCAYARIEYFPHLQALSAALASGSFPGYAYDPTPAAPSRWMIARHERGE